MNDEIKEILDRLEKIGYYASVPKELAYMTTNITPQECKTILDYITNLKQIEQDHKQANSTLMSELAKLEEENERLKENKESWQRVATKNFNDSEDYKSRCEKAIEYINIFKNDIRGLDEIVLLNILQNGSDDNV